MKLKWVFLIILLIAGCISPEDVVNPPEPTPTPIPVDPPKPNIEPSPTPSKIRVLIVEETDDRINPGMRNCIGTLNSGKIRSYLDSHCERLGDGPGWRWIDKDNDLRFADVFWQEASKLPRDSLPWIYITNGTIGTSGPLSCDEDENLELLKKWGGP